MREARRQQSNRRSTRRLPPRRTTQCTCIVAGKNDADILESMIDLSQSGARLVVKNKVNPGDELLLTVESSLLEAPLQLQLRVMWAVPLTDERHCVGVHFQAELSASDLEALTHRYAGAPWMFPSSGSTTQSSSTVPPPARATFGG